MLIEEIKNIVSTKKEARKFGIQIGVLFILISFLLFVLHKNYTAYFLVAGVILTTLGKFFPQILIFPNKIWMSFAIILGFFTSRLILIVLFYLVITPMGLIAKIFGKDFLDKKLNRQQESYWNKREKNFYDKSQTEKQF